MATVIVLTKISGEDCGRPEVAEAVSRTITVKYQWDAAAKRYVPESDAFDQLARDNEGRF